MTASLIQQLKWLALLLDSGNYSSNVIVTDDDDLSGW